MADIEKTLREIDELSWNQLREMVAEEMNTVPASEHIVFEWLFQRPWAEFEEMIRSVAEKDYGRIAQVRKNLAMLGDLTQSDIVELTILATLNAVKYKSPKLEYWMIGRLMHTRPTGKIPKIHKVLKRFGLI